jgi:hypothetical protein
VATETGPAPRTDSRPHTRPAQIVAWVFATFAAGPFFGLIDLATLPGWVNQEYVWAVPIEVSWGSLFTFMVAGSHIWIAVTPRRTGPALVQLGIVVVALAVSAAGGLDPRPVFVAAAIAASAALLGWLGRAFDGGTPRPSPNLPGVLLAVVGAAVWLPYALTALERSRVSAVGDLTNGIEHCPVQGAAGLAHAIGAAVMAVWRPARPLFRISISLSAVFIGMGNLAFPDRAGATEGLQWAVAVTLWGLLLALIPADPRDEPG